MGGAEVVLRGKFTGRLHHNIKRLTCTLGWSSQTQTERHPTLWCHWLSFLPDTKYVQSRKYLEYWEVNLIYWFYFGSRPRVLKAYNKNCPTKLPETAMVEEAHGTRHDSLLPRPVQSHKSPSIPSLTAVSLVLAFLLERPKVLRTQPYPLSLYLVVCGYPALLVAGLFLVNSSCFVLTSLTGHF